MTRCSPVNSVEEKVMAQEFDYCEECGERKSIYTEIYKGRDLCNKCRKLAIENAVPETIRLLDVVYIKLLKKSKLGGRSDLY